MGTLFRDPKVGTQASMPNKQASVLAWLVWLSLRPALTCHTDPHVYLAARKLNAIWKLLTFHKDSF